MFWSLARIPPTIATRPIATAAMRATLTSWSVLTWPRLMWLAYVVGEGCTGGDRQSCDHREDRREGDRRDEAEQQGATEFVGQQRAPRSSRRPGPP